MIRSKRRSYCLALLAALFTLSASRQALAVGISADPRVGTAPVEHLVVLARGPSAVVTVWPVRTGSVYLLPRPASYVQGSLTLVDPKALLALDKLTAPNALVLEASTFEGADCATEDTYASHPPIPHDPPKSAAEARLLEAEEMQRGLTHALYTRPGVDPADCNAATQASAPEVREKTGADVEAAVVAWGGALPAAFSPRSDESFFVLRGVRGLAIQYRTTAALDIPLVEPARGGARDTLAFTFVDLGPAGIPTYPPVKGLLPSALDGASTAGVLLVPRGLALAQAAAAAAEASFRQGKSVVLESAIPVDNASFRRDVCGAVGLGVLGSSASSGGEYSAFVVRARIRGLDRLAFRERSLPAPAATSFATLSGAPSASGLAEKSCLVVRSRGVALPGPSVSGPLGPLPVLTKVPLRKPAPPLAAPAVSTPSKSEVASSTLPAAPAHVASPAPRAPTYAQVRPGPAHAVGGCSAAPHEDDSRTTPFALVGCVALAVTALLRKDSRPGTAPRPRR